MVTGLQSYVFVFLLIPLALVRGGELPEFTLLVNNIDLRSAPTIQVEFSDGSKDKLVLWDHYFNEKERLLAPKTGPILRHNNGDYLEAHLFKYLLCRVPLFWAARK